MGKVCAWHCILSSQRKYVLLCAISLGACGNEGAQRRQTFDRQEWYYDILMCSAAGKYSSCLHFLFRGGFDTFWFGTSVFFFFFLNGFHPSLSLPRWRRRGENRKQIESDAVIALAFFSRTPLPRPSSIIYHALGLSISINLSCVSLRFASHFYHPALCGFPTNTAENERQQKKRGEKAGEQDTKSIKKSYFRDVSWLINLLLFCLPTMIFICYFF